MGSLSEALRLIDLAHAEDPRPSPSSPSTPFELFYAQKCTFYLHKLTPSPSPLLQIAVRAQHFKRWESPRSSYPMTKAGYFSWRTTLKRQQASQCAAVMTSVGFSTEDADRVSQMIRKEGIKSDSEVQVLEDVACCVFLDEYFEAFRKEHSEEKLIGILRKTWPKMSEDGHRVALEIDMSDEAQKVVALALGG